VTATVVVGGLEVKLGLAASGGPATDTRRAALGVPLMTWVVMPRVTRLLRGWLYPEGGQF
jgi:hypothetical protein